MIRLSIFFAWFGFIGLLILYCVDYVFLGPITPPQTIIFFCSILPLAIALWCSFRNAKRGLLLAGIAALFYFCHGVSEAWIAHDKHTTLFALIEIFLCLLLILSLGANTIMSKRKIRLTQSPKTSEGKSP
jgi:uncharacterized membrane protein